MATTQISLIREHTLKMLAPRALWVSFPLGRPLGKPGDAKFQQAVIEKALSLLERDQGPILEDFPCDVENDTSIQSLPACPVDFTRFNESPDPIDSLLNQLSAEINSMMSWFTVSGSKRKRTTSDLCGVGPDQLASFLSDFLHDKLVSTNCERVDLADKLRMAAEDLKAFYFEALSTRSEDISDPTDFSDWFWQKTCAAQVINEVRKKALSLKAKDMQLLGNLLLIPRNQMYRFKG
ncbi:hypothetical protein [Desulfosediminicola flagellatus]|uniref:hypothetical protein n=1 Tax=Desulfosediminicola flagellatus TaxID=2569541 RepID=UPI0010AB8554|nr:hypothetical protein [Desulfosediminicola flagellatus]